MFQFIQTVLIDLIQFSISTDFVYAQLNVKTVLYIIIQFSVSTVSMSKIVPLETIQLSISTQFKSKYSLFVKNISISRYSVLIQTIQFCISKQSSSIQPIDRALSGATTPCQSGPGSNGNEGVLHIPQSPSITGTSPSDCLMSYQDTHWGVLPLCRGAVGVFYSPSRLGNTQS